MAPLIAQLLASGVSLLGNALMSKGKEVVEEKLGVKLPDLNQEVPPEKLVELRALEFQHDEKLRELAIEQARLELEGEKVAQGAVTQRWQADMLSDSPLSKNIRPLVLLYLLASYTLMSLMSAANINVTQAYVELLGQMLMVAFSAYFVGRTWEKTVDMRERGRTE